jgi:hypothetical protein
VLGTGVLDAADPAWRVTVAEMSEKAPLWDAMVARYGLFPTPYEQIANWDFVDYMLNFAEETCIPDFYAPQECVSVASQGRHIVSDTSAYETDPGR